MIFNWGFKALPPKSPAKFENTLSMLLRNQAQDSNTATIWQLWVCLATLFQLTPLGAAEIKIDISGFWQLDEAASDDPRPMLKDIGKFEKKKRKDVESTGPRGDKPIGSDTYKRYWEHVAEDKEWRKVANAAHKGSIKSLVFNRRLAIAQTENGFKVWYQDGFVRDINPNPYGRVFSASGDELVANDLGRTLSYVKKDKIISETRTKPRGEILESFQASPDKQKLFVTIKVDRPDWSKIVKIKQIYTAVENSGNDAIESAPSDAASN